MSEHVMVVHGAHNIVVSNLTKAFGQVRAVRGINFEMERGTTVALLGPDGAGRTSSIDMMIGLATPDVGSVLLIGPTPAARVYQRDTRKI